MNDRLKPVLAALKVFALSLIIVLGVPRLAINYFSEYFISSLNTDLDNFKCTAFVIAQVSINMYPLIS